MSKIIDNLRFHFLFIDTYVFGSSWCFSENAVPYNMLRYITSGNGVFYINAEQIRVSPGMIIYIPRGCSLSCMSCSEAFSFISVRFTTSVTFDGDDILADYYAMPRSIRAEGEEIYFEQMLQWVKSEDIAKMYFVRVIWTC